MFCHENHIKINLLLAYAFTWPSFNSLPNNKILDMSKFKALPEDKINVTEKLKFVLGLVENIMGKGRNAGLYQHFPFPIMFSKGLFLRVVKSRDCVGEGGNWFRP